MYKKITRITPHRPPMVMIDGYKRINDDSALSGKTFCANDYGCCDGTVLDSILIECLAQTVAAHHGYKTLQGKNQKPTMGMLVSVDAFHFFHPVPEDASISLFIEKTDQIGPYKIMKGEIDIKGKLVASGQIKIYNPENEPE
jgi:predicted hotdog family 3-hydroxylacyl-ACP dehydratase